MNFIKNFKKLNPNQNLSKIIFYKIKILKKKHFESYDFKFFENILKNRNYYSKHFFKNYKNHIYSSLGGVFITLILFYLMTQLIAQKKDLSLIYKDNIFVQFLSSKELEELKTKDRRLLKEPKTPPLTPQIPKLNTQPNTPDKPKLSLPKQKLQLPKDFSKDQAFSGFGDSFSGSQGDSEVAPIVRIEPHYPRKAAMIGAEGFVLLKFDITPLGTVTNISILQASPPQIFNQSATRALQKWKYKPKFVNKKPVTQKNLKVRLDFKLENQ